jgi:excinuclease ABC subunit C
MKASPLDAVPGLGASRKQALLKHFGSLKRLRGASVEEICEVPGVGRKTAESVAAALVTKSSGPAVNTATGEIVEEE